MATIAQQLTELAQIKADLKSAIIAQGVSVSDSDPFSTYATKVSQISGGGGYVERFDFTQSLVGSVHGFTATLTSATRDSSGIHYTGPGDTANLPTTLLSVLRTYEIKVGTMSLQSAYTSAIIGYNTSNNGSTHGFAYNANVGKWGVWDPVNTWRNTDISDANYFANSVVKIEIGADRLWKIYKDNVLIFEPTGAFPMDGVLSFTIGGPGSNSFYNMTVESLDISNT